MDSTEVNCIVGRKYTSGGKGPLQANVAYHVSWHVLPESPKEESAFFTWYNVRNVCKVQCVIERKLRRGNLAEAKALLLFKADCRTPLQNLLRFADRPL